MTSIISGVGQVADEVWRARLEAASTATDAQSVKGTVQTVVASFFAQAEAIVAKAVKVMEDRVKQVAAYSDAKTSRVGAEVTE